MGAAYRASGRKTPIMDLFAFHSYPRFDRDPLTRGYAWPNAGITNLDRIKQAVWDAFHGTGQPTFAEAGDPVVEGARPPLRFALDEVGWQVQIPRASQRAYRGRENVRPTGESQQARIYSQIVDIAACDEAVDSLFFFHLIDEHLLDRFQSGLVRADWTKRASYFTVKSRIGQLTTADGVQCPGRPIAWRHTEAVVGATARFSDAGRGLPRVVARVREEASYVAAVFPVTGIELLGDLEEDAIRWVLKNGNVGLIGVPQRRGVLTANLSTAVAVPARGLVPGRYVAAIRYAATMNPERSTTVIGDPFVVR
jgi:hypothetical protein